MRSGPRRSGLVVPKQRLLLGAILAMALGAGGWTVPAVQADEHAMHGHEFREHEFHEHEFYDHLRPATSKCLRIRSASRVRSNRRRIATNVTTGP